jgi:hypothetical protein
MEKGNLVRFTGDHVRRTAKSRRAAAAMARKVGTVLSVGGPANAVMVRWTGREGRALVHESVLEVIR